MTVIELAERLLRLPEYAMNMEVTIRDAAGVDHADLFTHRTAATFPHLNFEFTSEEDETIWRKLGGHVDE